MRQTSAALPIILEPPGTAALPGAHMMPGAHLLLCGVIGRFP
jgi:hypothetical protein